jgi:hypothetical protein
VMTILANDVKIIIFFQLLKVKKTLRDLEMNYSKNMIFSFSETDDTRHK